MTSPKLQTKEKVIDIATAKYAKELNIPYDYARKLRLQALEPLLRANLPEGTFERV